MGINEAQTTPKAGGSRGEPIGDASPPSTSQNFPFDMVVSRSRKFCAICMVRKTVWLSETWTIEGRKMRYRLCWDCMHDDQRARIEEKYFG